MTRCFRFVSRMAAIGLLTIFCLTACASLQKSGTSMVSTDKKGSALSPILTAENQSQKYNLQLDFLKHHFSGLLVVRRLPDNEIRLLASTYFGLSLFDFSLQNDTFYVNSCIEPMKKEKILCLLETDFKNLFLGNKIFHTRKKKDFSERRITGHGFGKTVFTLSEFTNGQANRVQIKHPWIRLKIQVDRLNE